MPLARINNFKLCLMIMLSIQRRYPKIWKSTAKSMVGADIARIKKSVAFVRTSAIFYHSQLLSR